MIKNSSDLLLEFSKKKLENIEKHVAVESEPKTCADLPNWDPGLRPHILSTSQKRYLILKGPCQPKLVRYPQDSEIPANKQRHFSSRWYEEYPHLEHSVSKDAAFCFVYFLFKERNQDKAWTELGVSSWSKMKGRGTSKKGKLAGHFSSENHKEALKSFARFCDPLCQIDAMLDKSIRNGRIEEEVQRLEDMRAVKILMDVTRTLARQDIAFRGDGKLEQNGNFNQVVALVARHCPLLNSWLKNRSSRAYNISYMSPKSQNEMIKLLADDVRQRVIEDIKQARMFGVSADTTPDLSKVDQMTVVCRFVGTDGTPKERLLSMKPVISKTGNDTAKDIIDVLNSHSLDTDELCFQSYDFAATMSGRYNGAQQILQEKLNKTVPYIPCQAHRSNTVVEHSCNASPIIKDMFNMLQELYVFFTSSTKRLIFFILQTIKTCEIPLKKLMVV